MFKISWKFKNTTDTAGVWCEDRATLCTMIGMLESNDKVEHFKVEMAGHSVKSLYNELGIGNVMKFVTQFTYAGNI